MINTQDPPSVAPVPVAKPSGPPAVKLVKKKAVVHQATVKELREFGLLVGGIFLGLGLLALYRGKPAGPYFTPIGAILVVLGAVAPAALGPVYRMWMGFAEIMGRIMTRIILTVMYVLFMVPNAMIMRAMGKDVLDLKLDKTATSYWHMRKNPAPGKGEHFTNQF